MLAVTCTSLFSIYANITLRKMSMVISCTTLRGTYIQILIFSPRLQATVLYMFPRKEKNCTIFHISLLHCKNLEVGEKHKHTVSETNASALWIKLHLTHAVYYLRNMDQQDFHFFLFKFISIIILLVLITQIYHDARTTQCQTVYYVSRDSHEKHRLVP
jgi:hypothetical protein